MTDLKITELTENTAPATEDLLPTVDNPSGTAITKKVTLANVKAMGMLNSKLGTFTKDISSTATTEINDVGFQPVMVRIWGAIADSPTSSDGASDGTNQYCIYSPNFTTPATGKYGAGTLAAIVLLIDGSHYLTGTIAMTSDGFDITWSITGDPTGTANIFYQAYR